MLCDVVLLRDRGRRLRGRELGPPVRGDLRIGHANAEHTSFARPLVEAQLRTEKGVNGTLVDALPPLFDVRLVQLEGNRLSIVGIELARSEPGTSGRLAEFVQVWRCTLVLGDPKSSAAPAPCQSPTTSQRLLPV